MNHLTQNRRDFLSTALAGAASALAGGGLVEPAAAAPSPSEETVRLGKDLVVSKLGAGTGMSGGGRKSNQTRMGFERFEALANHAYDRGVRLFDAADMYGTHDFLKRALRGKPRDSYQLVSKIWTRRGGIPEKERPLAEVLIERFLKELGTDYLDLLQLHCMTDADWTSAEQQQMESMETLKKRGLIRAHGVSCHSVPALSKAADEPWVEVIHTRINPYGYRMDAEPEKVVPVIQRAHANGKGVIGMKLVGEGSFDAEKRRHTLEWVSKLGCVDVFIVGFETPAHVDELKQSLAAIASA